MVIDFNIYIYTYIYTHIYIYLFSYSCIYIQIIYIDMCVYAVWCSTHCGIPMLGVKRID